MVGWCWADVVLRRQVSDPQPKDLRPQAEVRSELSTCPLEQEPGQVDSLVWALSHQAQVAQATTNQTSPVAVDGSYTVRCWAEALASIDLARPPADVPPTRWTQLIDDIGRFVASSFGKKAAALGWTALDLFGCDGEKPFARIDRQGLCWLIAGNRIVDLSEHGAIIETWTGARQTWRRKQSEFGRVLPWKIER